MISEPKNLLFPTAKIDFAFSENVREASTNRVIVVRGTREGFLALANLILYFIASLRENFSLNELPFVSSSSISILVKLDNNVVKESGIITSEDETSFRWRISEEKLALIAALSIQPLGYTTEDHRIDHVHVDEGMKREDISIFCEIAK